MTAMLLSVPVFAEGTYLPSLDDIYWQPEAAPAVTTVPGFDEPPVRPLIAVIIDDAGVDQKRSARAVKNLAPEVTMSYLAYAPHIQDQVNSAKDKGHEIMLHLPWEPEKSKVKLGPHPLTITMGKEKLQKNLLANLDGFTGYVGVNNHTGSKFSRHRPGLEVVMAEIKKRDMYFIDSKTIQDSIAEKIAGEYGIPTTHRDFFLDHDEKGMKVSDALKQVERYAAKHGSVVLIGHPKDVSLAALESWLPTLEVKGFKLVPMSELLEYRQARKVASASIKK